MTAGGGPGSVSGTVSGAVPGAVLGAVRRDGPQAALTERVPVGASAVELIAGIRAAVALRDTPAEALVAWERAGVRHTPETLDEALGTVAPRLGVPFLAGVRRRRLCESARAALETTTCPGTARLLLAVLGAAGNADDALVMEELAVHPLLALHAVTALANLAHWEGRAALLRLLSTCVGTERVIVIDRLLPFVREPVVRLALVRDAFVGLSDDDAREVAPAVVAALGLADWLEEPRTPDDLRERARHILALAASASAEGQ